MVKFELCLQIFAECGLGSPPTMSRHHSELRNLHVTQALQIILEQVISEPLFQTHRVTSLTHSPIHALVEHLSRPIVHPVLC